MQPIQGTVQPYAWGSMTALPALLGEEPTGEPQAELWFGAHSRSPSTIEGQPLDQLISASPEAMIGAAAVAAYGPKLPFLVKILAIAQPLSMQAHPSRTQAEAGFAREEANGPDLEADDRIYRDSWPKPELVCALEPSEVLCGFRDPRQTFALFQALGASSALALLEPLAHGGSAEIAVVFERILRGDHSHVVRDVLKAAQRVSSASPEGALAATAVELAGHYGHDSSILAALLMNRLTLRRPDGLFLGAGNLHAYLSGMVVEVMANSDNVIRGGLTGKHIDVDELLTLVDFTPITPSLVDCVEDSARVWRYRTPAPEFALWRLEPAGPRVGIPAHGHGRVVLVTDGVLDVATEDERLSLRPGHAVFLSPADDAMLSGSGVAFLGAPGLDA